MPDPMTPDALAVCKPASTTSHWCLTHDQFWIWCVEDLERRTAALHQANEAAQTQRVRESQANTDLARANRELLATLDAERAAHAEVVRALEMLTRDYDVLLAGIPGGWCSDERVRKLNVAKRVLSHLDAGAGG